MLPRGKIRPEKIVRFVRILIRPDLIQLNPSKTKPIPPIAILASLYNSSIENVDEEQNSVLLLVFLGRSSTYILPFFAAKAAFKILLLLCFCNFVYVRLHRAPKSHFPPHRVILRIKFQLIE
jgi:hypothetical protein